MVIFKLLFLSYMPTTLYVSFYHTNSIAMFYIVHESVILEKNLQLLKYPVANVSPFDTTRFQMLYVPIGFQIHKIHI